MPTSAAQYQFAAEFALFLVAASGLALTALRGDLLAPARWARVPLAAGFAGLAAAAFVHGSLISPANSPVVVGFRGGGLALVAVGVLRWRAGPTQGAMAFGVAVGVGGLVAALADADGWAAVLRVASALLMGAGLLLAGNRSIVTRVAASAAASVLLIVLVTSVGLSAVLDSQVQDGAVRRLDARARQAAARIAGETQRQLGREATFLIARISDGDIRQAAQGQASEGINAAVESPSFDAPRAFVLADGRIVAVAALDRLPRGTLERVVASDLYRQALSSGTSRTGLIVTADLAVVAAVQPVSAPGGGRALGAGVMIQPLDRAYLDQESTDDAATSLALVGPGGVLATFGDPPPATVLQAQAAQVFGTSTTSVLMRGDRFIAAAPVVEAGGSTPLALVASQPTEVVEKTRQELFNTLFLIALGGAVLALAFAAVVGERIGAGVRRLTTAAQRVQAGDLSVRTNLVSSDEVGVLSQAFDSMAASIDEQTTALQAAAADEARLRNRLQAIVSGMGEALVAVDAGGGVTEMNEAAEAMFGVLTGAALGRRIDDLARISSEEGLDLGRMLARPPAERWSSPAVLHTETGAVPVALSVGPLEGPGGERSGAVVMLRDLRREREVERMKREFLSRVGHELRTPLAPIMGFSQLLVSRPVTGPAAAEMLSSIHESSKKLKRIIEMLEFFASLEAGRQVLNTEVTAVRDIIEAAVASRSPAINGSHQVTRRVARQLPPVRVDPAWLEKAVGELIDNAAKFSPKGGRISVRADLVQHAGKPRVAITVADKGIGMTEEQLDQAFTEWSQGDESDTRSFGGLGLGLPLVRRVAQALGGDVIAESEPDKGSKVSILLPPVDDGPAPRRARSSRGAAAGSRPA